MRSAGATAARPRTTPVRHVALGSLDVVFERRPGGVIRVRSPRDLDPYPDRLTDRLVHWAAEAPDRTFVAEREPSGAWRRVSYAETLALVRRIGQGLLDRGLSAERPLAILSGNDIEHALLGLAALYAGIPYAPISPAYSTVSTDHGKLRHILDLLTPGLVFAADGAAYGRAIATVVPPDTEVVVTTHPPASRHATLFASLAETRATPAVEAAHRAVGPDTIAKILFTSGSTGWPKGVINTQRMLTSNQVMLRTVLSVLQEAPPVIVDWLPWNHTFGGNHNVGLVLYNGGSLYIDAGRPTPVEILHTVRNLREIAPTIYFNVPKGYEMLLPHLHDEPDLAKNFFSRLKLTFFAAAGMPKPVWDALDEIAMKTCGEQILMLTGLGATESAPFALSCGRDNSRSGHVGVPVPGVELKLVPNEGKLEARLRGPNITPGYWRQPELTARAFDEEGFYRLGDALRFIDPENPEMGFAFDGRIAEDFKLATGTWVSTGPLRARLIDLMAPHVRDVVIAGLDRDEVTALVFPDIAACRALCPDLGLEAPIAVVLADKRVRAAFREALAALAAEATGSSKRIARAILLADPPSIDAREMTDKGSINQGAVLTNRAALVEELYGTPHSPRVITLRPPPDA
jgi:feruloyl-CoA synthase